MSKLIIKTPEWAEKLLYPKRYKGAKGGRGCVHPDTLLDTPNGKIKIKDFKGGEIYSFYKGKIIIAEATLPKEYTKEQLYEVTLTDGKKIVCTDEHKFLTITGWKMLSEIDDNHSIAVSNFQKFSFCLPQTNLDTCLSGSLLDAQHYSQKHEDYQDDCLLYLHQYGQQLLFLLDTFPVFSQQPTYEQLHSFRVLCHLDGLEFSYKHNLSSFLYHLSNLHALLIQAGRNYVKKENYIFEQFFEQILDSFQSFQLFHKSNNLQQKVEQFSKLLLDCESLKYQAQNLQTICEMLLFFFDDNSFCLDLGIKIVKIKHIRKHSHLKYWDIHVPKTNCYFANGILNHNSGKSHFFAELLVEAMVLNPNTSVVCIREIQKSLKFSAKRLIEQKIEYLGVSNLFSITLTEIRAKEGNGVILFQGMQDHTADSIKSLEGFDIAWVEEAQNLSARSLQLLRPTIRKEGSEIWFSWNPERPTDPVDAFFQNKSSDMILVHVNSEQNPFLPETLRKERDADRLRMSPEDYDHVWNGAYNEKSDALVFKDKYEVDDFEPQEDWTRLQGLDWGFSQDPTVAVELYVNDDVLYIRREAGKVGLELDETVPFILQTIPDFDKFTIRADNARPESISHVKRKGFSKIKGEPKLRIEEGINFMRNFDRIVIHLDCKGVIKEFGLYSYKIDKRSGDILPVIVDENNHYIDAIRYALYPLITKRGETKVRSTTKTSYRYA